MTNPSAQQMIELRDRLYGVSSNEFVASVSKVHVLTAKIARNYTGCLSGEITFSDMEVQSKPVCLRIIKSQRTEATQQFRDEMAATIMDFRRNAECWDSIIH